MRARRSRPRDQAACRPPPVPPAPRNRSIPVLSSPNPSFSAIWGPSGRALCKSRLRSQPGAATSVRQRREAPTGCAKIAFSCPEPGAIGRPERSFRLGGVAREVQRRPDFRRLLFFRGRLRRLLFRLWVRGGRRFRRGRLLLGLGHPQDFGAGGGGGWPPGAWARPAPPEIPEGGLSPPPSPR